MWNFPLNQISYKLYAIAHYKNGKSTWNEFFLDMKLLQSIYRLVQAHQEKHIYLNNIINAIIRLGNVFNKESLGRLLLVQSPEELRSDIKTILYFIHRLPENIPEYDLDSIEYNQKLIDELNKL